MLCSSPLGTRLRDPQQWSCWTTPFVPWSTMQMLNLQALKCRFVQKLLPLPCPLQPPIPSCSPSVSINSYIQFCYTFYNWSHVCRSLCAQFPWQYTLQLLWQQGALTTLSLSNWNPFMLNQCIFFSYVFNVQLAFQKWWTSRNACNLLFVIFFVTFPSSGFSWLVLQ